MSLLRHSGFVLLCHSTFRASSFLQIFEISVSLEQSIHANRDEKYRAHECIALKERAIDSGQIEFLDFVFVNQRRCNQRHRPVIECAQIRGETKTNQRQERQKM